MSKYMFIMRSTAEAVEDYEEMDFEAVINAMGAYNESHGQGWRHGRR